MVKFKNAETGRSFAKLLSFGLKFYLNLSNSKMFNKSNFIAADSQLDSVDSTHSHAHAHKHYTDIVDTVHSAYKKIHSVCTMHTQYDSSSSDEHGNAIMLSAFVSFQ